MASVVFNMQRAFRPMDPTGEKCEECGDTIYLSQSEMFYRFGEGVWRASGKFYCDSCVDLLQRKDDD